jgi:hypothetical protein
MLSQVRGRKREKALMTGYSGPNNRRYEKKRWMVIAAIVAAFTTVAGFIGLRKSK